MTLLQKIVPVLYLLGIVLSTSTTVYADDTDVVKQDPIPETEQTESSGSERTIQVPIIKGGKFVGYKDVPFKLERAPASDNGNAMGSGTGDAWRPSPTNEAKPAPEATSP